MKSIDIAVSYNFIASIVVMIFGLFLAGYVLALVVNQKRGKDLSYRLFSNKHRLVLKSFSLPGAKIVMVTVLLCAMKVLVELFYDVWEQIKFGGGLNLIPWRSYLSYWMVIGFTVVGFIVHVGSGDKGVVLPIGNGLSLSFDKRNLLAFHLTEDSPNIKAIAKMVVPVVKNLRARGINNPLVFRSWIFVSQIDREDEVVKRLRIYFKYVQWPSLLLDKISLGWLNKLWLGRKLFTLILPVFTAPLYAVILWGRIACDLSRLPDARLRETTQKLISVLVKQTGNRVEVINPTSVSPFTFVNLGVKFPTIADSFGGQDGGFILYSS